jgi:Phosphodiester glycosidase
VLRKLVIASLAAISVVAPGSARAQELMPGVTYQRQVQFTLHGPVVINVLTMPRPGSLWTLGPVLSNEQIQGTEKLTAIERRLSSSATVAGVNGDLTASGGRPDGLLIRGGVVDHGPRTARTSIGIDTSGTLRLDRITLFGHWQGSGGRHAFTLVNEPPRSGTVALFTPAWGAATPTVSGSVAVVLRPFPAASPNVDLTGTSAQVVPGGAAAIPSDGAVLVARGSTVAGLQAEAAVGQTVQVRLTLQPDWAGVPAALGGGPLLVRNGKSVFNAAESIPTNQLALRKPRTGVGQRADGSIVLVTVDGGLPGYSSGLTNYELAQALVRLGVQSGAALAPDREAGMAFDGKLLSKPAAGERGIADALVVGYAGVYAPEPSEPVLSPNGDGVDESERLGYRLVRPSTVTVSLIGPDGVARSSVQSTLGPGAYPFQWNGRRADGTPEQEGRWRFAVSAVDDLGRASAAERGFSLDLTLGSPKTIAPALLVPRPKARPVASFALTRAATVKARIESTSGVVLRTFPQVKASPGTFIVSWDGVAGTRGTVYSGRYVARAIATSAVGTVDLRAPFTVRRLSAKAAG